MAIKTPWHLWVVGILALVWNAGGAFDYVMTQTRNDAYLSQFSPEALAWFDSFPIWVQGSWAIAVWFAVAGAVLLLARSRHAVPVFTLSLIAMLLTAIHNFILSTPSMSEVIGPFAIVFTTLIAAISVFLLWYARYLRARDVLR